MERLQDPEHYMPDAARLEKAQAAIAGYNVERPKILKLAYGQVAVFMGLWGLAVLVLLYAALKAGPDNKIMTYVLAAGAVAGYWVWDYAWKPVRDHQLTLRYRLFPEIFGFVDNVRYSHGQAPGFLEALKAIKLVRFTKSEADDSLSGRHEGLSFELVETKLVSGSGKHKTTLFSGLIFRFPLDQPFPGLLFAAKRGTWLQQVFADLFRTHDDRLTCGRPALDASHEFHSDHHAAARPLVEGPLASALEWLGREWHDDRVLIALKGSDCYLLLPSKKDYFALPPIDRDVDMVADAVPMIRELVVLLAVAHLVRKLGVETEEGAEADQA